MKYESQTKIRLNARKLLLMRAKRRWTQKTAAKQARIGLPTYRNAELGLPIQAAKAGAIAKGYDVVLEEICA